MNQKSETENARDWSNEPASDDLLSTEVHKELRRQHKEHVKSQGEKQKK